MSLSFQMLMLTPSIDMPDMRDCVRVQASTKTQSSPTAMVNAISPKLVIISTSLLVGSSAADASVATLSATPPSYALL
jgi:hypothetical protein